MSTDPVPTQGTEILLRAQEHFRDRRNLVKIDVPEWGEDGTPAELYYYPALTMAEKNQVWPYLGGDTTSLEGLVVALIMLARNADGDKMFKKVERSILMKKVDGAVIESIINSMQFDLPTLEEAEEN